MGKLPSLNISTRICNEHNQNKRRRKIGQEVSEFPQNAKKVYLLELWEGGTTGPRRCPKETRPR